MIPVAENWNGDRGRGVVAIRKFAKNKIVVEYHAKFVSRADSVTILSAETEDDRRSDYDFCLPGGIFLDGSAETCECHPQTHLMGRLLNFAWKESAECNARPDYFEVRAYCKLVRTVVFVAKRDIEVLKEIRFYYGDKSCLEIFLASGAGISRPET